MLTRPDPYSENPELWSDLMQAIEARCTLSAGVVAGGDWSVHVAPYEGLKFNVLVRGEAWLHVEGGDPVCLRQGDCFLLGRGQAFTVASDLALPPTPASVAFAATDRGFARIGTVEEVRIVAGRMTLGPVLAPFLSASLPALTVFAAASAEAESVHWLLQRLTREIGSDAPARLAVADRLVEIIFVELLRAADAAPGGRAGWLGALADRRLARVLHAIHADPARRWTLQELAAIAHMSRSAFADAFRSKVGMPPLRYLQHWRLHTAGQALRNRRVSISAAAALAGYASDSAFVSAFRRLFGATPARYAGAPVTRPSGESG